MNAVARYRSKDFVHKILLPKSKDQWQISQWCKEQFGPKWSVTENRQGTWCCFWRGMREEDFSMYEWLFVNEQDAVLFMLRWA